MRNVIKKDRVRIEAPAPSTAAGGAASRSAGAVPATAVRAVEVDGRIHAIEVTCRCGVRSVVELEYDDDGPGAAAEPAATT